MGVVSVLRGEEGDYVLLVGRCQRLSRWEREIQSTSANGVRRRPHAVAE